MRASKITDEELLELQNSPLIQYTLKNPNQIRAEMCRRDFFFFIQEFWDEIISDEPVWNWHIEYLCTELQTLCYRVMGRLPKLYDLVVNIPPGTTKSTIFAQMFQAWTWAAVLPRAEEYNEAYEKFDLLQERKSLKQRQQRIVGADLRFICGSYSNALALEHADNCRDIVRSNRYRNYFPELRIRQDKELKSNYKLNTGGTRFSTSVGASVTGVHAHIIVIDDPINPEGSCSEADRLQANRWIEKTLSTRKVDKKVTPTILIMQRLHEADPSGMLLEKKGRKAIKHICLPGELPGKLDKYQVSPIELQDKYIDGLLDPNRLSDGVLDEMHIDLGSYGYAGQVMQSPAPGEGGTFERQWFKVIHETPADGLKIRYWDFASTEAIKGKDPDYTVGGLGTWKDGQLIISNIIRKRLSPMGVEKLVEQAAMMDGKSVEIWIEQEPGSSGKIVIDHYQRKVLPGYIVKGEPKSKGKVELARPYSAAAEAGNVLIVKGGWNVDFLNEHEIFPNGKHDDIVDVCSGLHRKLTDGEKSGVIWV